MTFIQIIRNISAIAITVFYLPWSILALLLATLKRKLKFGSMYLNSEQLNMAIKCLAEFPVQHLFFSSSDGLKLHYIYKEKITSGPKKGVIIFYHGFPSNWFCWKYQIKYFTEIGYDVVAPDVRGFGDSDRPLNVYNYEMPKLVSDVNSLMTDLKKRKILKNNTNHEKPILIGHDWGGVITSQFALENSEELEKHIIINSMSIKTWAGLVWSNLKQFLMSYYTFTFQIPLIPELILCGRALPKIGGPKNLTISERYAYMYYFRHFWQATTGINLYRANGLWSGYWWMGEKKERFFGHKIGVSQRIRVDGLIIWAKGDIYLHESMPEIERINYDRCQVQYLKDKKATHWCIEENHDEVNSYVENFINS